MEKWGEIMDRVLNRMSKDELEAMSKAGVERVTRNFADTQMGEKLDGIFDEMETETGPGRSALVPVVLAGVVDQEAEDPGVQVIRSMAASAEDINDNRVENRGG